MTSKTYGQVLRNELNARVEGLRLSIADTNALEKVAQSVILEFVRRVEEEKDAWMEEVSYSDDCTSFDNHIKAIGQAFRKIAAELKEAK